MPRQVSSNFIRGLIVSADDSLWFGTYGGGVCHYDPVAPAHRRWQIHTFENDAANNIRCLLETEEEDGRTVLWVGTNAGLYRLRDGVWSGPEFADVVGTATVRCLARTKDADGRSTFWVGTTTKGLFRRRGGEWKAFDDKSGLPSNFVSCVLGVEKKSGPGDVWVGTQRGLVRFQEDALTVFGKAELGLDSEEVTALCKTRDAAGEGTLWVGTIGGLAHQTGNRWRAFGTQSGLPSEVVRCLFVTGENGREVLWIGFGGGGIASMQALGWLTHSTVTGLPSNLVRCVQAVSEPDGKASIWVGTSLGLAVWRDGAWKTFREADGFKPDDVTSLEVTENGSERIIWVGTRHFGLARFEKGRVTYLDSKTGRLPHDWVRCLKSVKTKTGNTIWIGTEGGLMTLPLDQAATPELHFEKKPVNCIGESRFGVEPTVWVGMNDGLSYRDQGQWKRVDFGEGANKIMVNCVRFVTGPEGQPSLWVGIQSGGLFRLALDGPPRVAERLNRDTSPALPNDVIYALVEDAQHRLYALTNRGVVRFGAQAGERREGTRQLYTFTTEDGLPSNECNQGAAAIDGKGRVWVGTLKGVTVFDPAIEPRDATAKPLVIEQMLLNGKPQPPEEGMSFPYTVRDVSFRFALASFFRNGDTLYQTQLEPYDPAPTPWSSQFTRDYSNLSAGSYVFRVWGRDYAGNVTGPVLVRFTIQTALWRQGWAYVLYAIALLGFAYAIYDLRIRQIRRMQENRIVYLRQLLESTRAINSTLELGAVLKKIAEESAKLIDAEPGGIGLIEDGQLIFRYVWRDGMWEDTGIPFEIGRGVAGKVAATGKSLIVNDVNSFQDFAHPDLTEQFRVRGMLDTPIVSRNGKVVGVLDVRLPEGRRPFTEQDCELLEGLTNQAAVAIENANINQAAIENAREMERLFKREQQVTTILRDLDVMKNNFMAVTSHEMRTPLTVLRGFTEALIMDTFGELSDSQRNALVTCLKTVDRLSLTVDEIFEMLQIQEGEVALRMESVDVAQLLRDTLAELSVFTDRRNLSIELNSPATLPMKADERKLGLVFLNVLQNAVKFTSDGGTVSVTAEGDDIGIRVVITDTGIGIPEGDLERIFERFYTGPDSSRHSSGRFEFNARGTGLGLAIAKSYVEAHHGTITAESDGLGKGSRFIIDLPRSLDTRTGEIHQIRPS
jgi:signal transduction histidine kinase/ligand-binding sensor domain-containing protein